VTKWWCMSCAWPVFEQQQGDRGENKGGEGADHGDATAMGPDGGGDAGHVWLLTRCAPADETHRADRTTPGQSPRRQDTCHPHDRPTGPGIPAGRDYRPSLSDGVYVAPDGRSGGLQTEP
jgi:hypothetical protein